MHLFIVVEGNFRRLREFEHRLQDSVQGEQIGLTPDINVREIKLYNISFYREDLTKVLNSLHITTDNPVIGRHKKRMDIRILTWIFRKIFKLKKIPKVPRKYPGFQNMRVHILPLGICEDISEREKGEI